MTEQRSTLPTLFDEVSTVTKNGLCVGCGACAFGNEGTIMMARSKAGARVARIDNPDRAAARPGGVCPFSDAAPNEDAHGAALFGETEHLPPLGYVRNTWAGFVAEGDFRGRGSSGGGATWILSEAMSQGEIDAVVHVWAGAGDGLFGYEVSYNIDEIRNAAKTRYYSVDFASALDRVKAKGLRFAFVGVPCFIKAARNLALQDADIRRQMILTVSLICGHMKSAGFAESLAWQAGVPPERIASFDFRVKLEGKSAQQYGIQAEDSKTGAVAIAPMGRLAGRRWDGGYHRLKACDYCDDVFGETADVTFGDAWLPAYHKDPGGTNVIVSRSALAERLLREGRDSGALAIHELARDQAIASQNGGLRDRRQGLAYRLHRSERKKAWHPQKRIKGSSEGISTIRKLNYSLRQLVRERSADNLVFCKRIGTILPYRAEMTFWHACFRMLQILEKRFS